MTAAVAEAELPHLGGELDYPGGHPLHTAWLIWHEKKPKGSGQNGGGGASRGRDDSSLRLLGRFNTVETFWQHYVYLERAPDVGKDNTVHFFRDMYPLRGEGYKGYPGAGCFVLKVHRTLGAAMRLWEKLLLATIGESFEDLGVMGCSLTMGAKQNLLFGLWFTNAKKDKERLERIRLTLRDALGLPELLAAQAEAQLAAAATAAAAAAAAAAHAPAADAKPDGHAAGGANGGKGEKAPLYVDVEFYDMSGLQATQHPASPQLCRVLAIEPLLGGGGGGGGGNGGGGNGGNGSSGGGNGKGHSASQSHQGAGGKGKGKGGNGGGGDKGDKADGEGSGGARDGGKAKGARGGGAGGGGGGGGGAGGDKEKGADKLAKAGTDKLPDGKRTQQNSARELSCLHSPV
ncbi:hypothetical protein KFE25_009292 [Diacronema lutheri]|uniref:Eukaryotic translation initiation factor 4E n=2 Tax=Diacronema lutheri TaxID=2081491 RepID=A0A8J6CH76_DIALT|nr:hypothetical protein KFE25_009292 [Diacronema lutheri]